MVLLRTILQQELSVAMLGMPLALTELRQRMALRLATHPIALRPATHPMAPRPATHPMALLLLALLALPALQQSPPQEQQILKRSQPLGPAQPV